jgi:hypothetical protein
MYILPYVLEDYKQGTSEFAIRTLWLFLTQHGKSVWETDEKGKVSQSFVVKEYLHANGFYGTVTCVKKNTLFFKVDPSKTNMDNFYMWNDEEVGEEEVWRPFFWIDNKTMENNQHWGWKEQTQKLGLGSFGSLDIIWDTVLERSV